MLRERPNRREGKARIAVNRGQIGDDEWSLWIPIGASKIGRCKHQQYFRTEYSVQSTQYTVLSTPIPNLLTFAIYGAIKFPGEECPMPGVNRFTDLIMWQKARVWSKAIFIETKNEPFCSDRRLVDQINASSASVAANIA